MRKIIDCCGDPIVVYDPDGLAVYINPAFERVFGWRSHELMGQRIDFVPEQAIEQTREAAERVIAGKAVFGLETVRKTKDRGIIYVRVSADSLKDGDGKFKGMVVTLQDITDIIRSREEAFKANQAKSDFLSNVSHEIRTPMNGLLGMIDLLQQTPLNEEQQEFLEVLQKSAMALMAVITNILDFSKIESGKIECETIDFDLRTTMDAVKKSISPKMDKKGLKFVVSVHHQVPSLLKGDPQRLRQIINCLLDNAVKFTHQGQITVTVVFIKEDSIHATLRFEVEDTGIGIEPHQLKTIFESFSQADSSPTRKYGGTGIGLSISKQLVHLMGGKVDLKTTPGKGSIFGFIIEFEKQRMDSKALVSIPKIIKGTKLLIVDDDAANRLILKELLKSWGCIFEEAATAERALEKLAPSGQMGQQFDIALIDMQLPGMDGETLAKQIRSNPDFTQMLLIMLSSMGKRGDVARLSKIGVQGYLPKPVKPSLLFDCIATAQAMKGQKIKQIITRHFLRENKKKRLGILFIELARADREMVEDILNKSGFRVEIAENMTQAQDAFETGRFNFVLMEANPLEAIFIEKIKMIREIEKKNSFEKTIIVAVTELPAKGEVETGVDDYISKPVTSENLLPVIEKWTQKAADEFERKMTPFSGKNIFNFEAALERAMDDKSFLEMLLNEFIQTLPKKLEVMKEALLKKDAAALTRQAHSLRGSAATIGADGISKAALALEKIGDLGDFESLHKKLNQFENEYQIFKAHINTIKWSDV